MSLCHPEMRDLLKEKKYLQLRNDRMDKYDNKYSW